MVEAACSHIIQSVHGHLSFLHGHGVIADDSLKLILDELYKRDPSAVVARTVASPTSEPNYAQQQQQGRASLDDLQMLDLSSRKNTAQILSSELAQVRNSPAANYNPSIEHNNHFQNQPIDAESADDDDDDELDREAERLHQERLLRQEQQTRHTIEHPSTDITTGELDNLIAASATDDQDHDEVVELEGADDDYEPVIESAQGRQAPLPASPKLELPPLLFSGYLSTAPTNGEISTEISTTIRRAHEVDNQLNSGATAIVGNGDDVAGSGAVPHAYPASQGSLDSSVITSAALDPLAPSFAQPTQDKLDEHAGWNTQPEATPVVDTQISVPPQSANLEQYEHRDTAPQPPLSDGPASAQPRIFNPAQTSMGPTPPGYQAQVFTAPPLHQQHQQQQQQYHLQQHQVQQHQLQQQQLPAPSAAEPNMSIADMIQEMGGSLPGVHDPSLTRHVHEASASTTASVDPKDSTTSLESGKAPTPPPKEFQNPSSSYQPPAAIQTMASPIATTFPQQIIPQPLAMPVQAYQLYQPKPYQPKPKTSTRANTISQPGQSQGPGQDPAGQNAQPVAQTMGAGSMPSLLSPRQDSFQVQPPLQQQPLHQQPLQQQPLQQQPLQQQPLQQQPLQQQPLQQQPLQQQPLQQQPLQQQPLQQQQQQQYQLQQQYQQPLQQQPLQQPLQQQPIQQQPPLLHTPIHTGSDVHNATAAGGPPSGGSSTGDSSSKPSGKNWMSSIRNSFLPKDKDSKKDKAGQGTQEGLQQGQSGVQAQQVQYGPPPGQQGQFGVPPNQFVTPQNQQVPVSLPYGAGQPMNAPIVSGAPIQGDPTKPLPPIQQQQQQQQQYFQGQPYQVQQPFLQQPNQLQVQPPGLQQAPSVASVEANRADPVNNSILNPEASEAASAASAVIEAGRMTAIDGVKETAASPTAENSNRQSGISEVRNVQVIARAQALFDFAGEDEGDLPFKVGDIINVIEFLNADWWRGILRKDVGIFPTAYVQELKAPANGKYPTISVSVRQSIVGPMSGGDLPPPDQGQFGGSQGSVLSQQPSPVPPPADGSPVAAPPAPSSGGPTTLPPSDASGNGAFPAPPPPASIGSQPGAMYGYFPGGGSQPPISPPPSLRNTNVRPPFAQGQQGSFQGPPASMASFAPGQAQQHQQQQQQPISPQQPRYGLQQQQSFQQSFQQQQPGTSFGGQAPPKW
ncbi:ESCRT-0 subunit protein hse1 [Mortierella sp. NVP85]|nr:ESCRT-0 subunit protein hse1 [Mortierella sp. NVP85]